MTTIAADLCWTDARTERLKQMWLEGSSASQIAAELGGITRNAVIGKVHRLGLSGRAKTALPRTPRPARSRGPRAHRPRAQVTVSRERRALRMLEALPDSAAIALADDAVPLEVNFPIDLRRSLTQLDDDHCKWPVGDPQSADFFFCGAPAVEPLPYCGRCARLAYNFSVTARSDRKYATAWGPK